GWMSTDTRTASDADPTAGEPSPVPPSPGYQVRVAEVVDETADARSFVLESTDAWPGYLPGQFLTVRIPDADAGGARCYSLASSPHADPAMKFTVKRVPGGRGSNWLCDTVRAGDELEVLPPAGGGAGWRRAALAAGAEPVGRPPAGAFTPASLDEPVVLVAGGSGITPVIPIAKSVLSGGAGDVVLVDANRDQDSVIFADELR